MRGSLKVGVVALRKPAMHLRVTSFLCRSIQCMDWFLLLFKCCPKLGMKCKITRSWLPG